MNLSLVVSILATMPLLGSLRIPPRSLHMLLFALLSVLGVCVGEVSHAATIAKQGTSVIVISGSIASGDSDAFLVVLNQVRHSTKETILVRIDSPGGSVPDALSIGRAIRRAQAYVFITPGTNCFSSCVLVLASGVTRVVKDAQVGIHRPFLTSSPTESISQVLRSMERTIREYLREMNVLESLADDMFSIPPSSVRILSPSELERYRLVGTDQIYEEETDLRLMKKYGLDRIEFNKRKGQLDRACSQQKGNDGQMSSCIDQVMRGSNPAPVRGPAQIGGSDVDDQEYFRNSYGVYAISWKSLRRLSDGTIAAWTDIRLSQPLELNGRLFESNQTRHVIDCESASLWAAETHFRDGRGQVTDSVREVRQMPAMPGSPGGRLVEIVCTRR